MHDRFQVHYGPVNDLSYATGVIASVGWDGTMQHTGTDGASIRRQQLPCPLHAVEVADSRTVVGGADGVVYVVREATTQQLGVHDGAVECLCVVGRYLLSGSRDGTIGVWNLASGEHLANLHGHLDWVTRIAAVGAEQAMSVGEDGLVIAWDLQQRREIWRLDLGNPVWGLAVHRTSSTAYVGKAGKPVTVDIAARTVRDIDGVGGFAARAISISCNGLVALGHDGGGIDFLEHGSSARAWGISGGHRGVLTATFSGARCITGHQNGSVTVCDHDGGARESHNAHGFMAYTSTALADSRAAVGSLDGKISIWDLDASQRIRTLDHGGQVFALTATQDSTALLSAGDNHWIQWRPDTWEPLHREDELGSGNHTLGAISRDGRVVVCVGENALLKVWMERCLTDSFALPYQDSSAVAIAPDGASAYVAFKDGVIGVVPLQSGEFAELHRVHDSWVRQLFVSADGSRILSCSQNGIAAVFEMRDRTTRVLAGTPIAAVGFTPTNVVGFVDCTGTVGYDAG